MEASLVTLRHLYDMAQAELLYRMEWAPIKDGPWTRTNDIVASVSRSPWTKAEIEEMQMLACRVPANRVKDIVLEYGTGAQANSARQLMLEDLEK